MRRLVWPIGVLFVFGVIVLAAVTSSVRDRPDRPGSVGVQDSCTPGFNDLNHDGTVDFKDIAILADHWLGDEQSSSEQIENLREDDNEF